MSDFRAELAQGAAGLEAVSNAAMTSLGLAPDQFAWFTGEIRQPMPPQRILPDSNMELDHFTSNVTFYGGLITNKIGDFACGHIQASISEPIPGGVLHQAGLNLLPVPYIPRLLTMKDQVITVDTPTVNPSLNEGPVVVEGNRYNPRFRYTTLYNAETGGVTVKSGELITDGRGWKDDRTVERDAFTLPGDILLPRLATVIRTVQAASSLFDHIARQDARRVSWAIKKEPPR